jgi:SAM-dependent methyltransferase
MNTLFQASNKILYTGLARMANLVRETLLQLGLIDANSIEPYAARVRDRDDLHVLRCRRSGIIFLSSTDHVSDALYAEKDHLEPVRASGVEVQTVALDDDRRRAAEHRSLISGRRWLDVGAGAGGLLDLLRGEAALAAAVEPNRVMRTAMASRGHKVFRSIDDVDVGTFDVITLFHVLEHLTDPVGDLTRLGKLLDPAGVLVAEVPHARDALLALYDCDSFRAFTLWSEHLILHTRASLEGVLRAAGYANVTINGVQRYPLANHLHWLAKGKPGGHEVWSQMADPTLDAAYANMLRRIDSTDTLVAHAVAPGAPAG